MDPITYKYLQDWLNLIKNQQENKETWTHIPNVGYFKNLKFIPQPSELDNQINITLKYDEWEEVNSEASMEKAAHEKSPTKRYQDDKTLKWNIQRKSDDSFISDVWFDNLITSTHYYVENGIAHYEFGWEGLVFLEPPVKTKQGCYPFWVKAKCYSFSIEGEFTSIHDEISCGIWHDNSEKINFIY